LARNRLERQGEVTETRMVYHWPKESQSRPESPVGETLLDGKLYEVYRDPKGMTAECLYYKTGTKPLPRVRLARANMIVHIRRVEEEG
jgi:hypothetical protein